MGMQTDDGTHTFKLVQSDIWVPATDLTNGTGSSALESVDAVHNGRLFDGTTSEVATIGLVVPRHWNRVQLTYYTYNPGANSGGVVLGTYVQDLEDADSLTAETPTIVSDAVITAGSEDALDITEGTSEHVVTPGGYVNFAVGRLPADGSDTLTGDYALLGFRITRVA